MLVVGMPSMVVKEDGIYKNQEVATYENNPRIKTYVSEIMITKEAFIEAYNKWIKDPKEVKNDGTGRTEGSSGCSKEDQCQDKRAERL